MRHTIQRTVPGLTTNPDWRPDQKVFFRRRRNLAVLLPIAVLLVGECVDMFVLVPMNAHAIVDHVVDIASWLTAFAVAAWYVADLHRRTDRLERASTGRTIDPTRCHACRARLLDPSGPFCTSCGAVRPAPDPDEPAAMEASGDAAERCQHAGAPDA